MGLEGLYICCFRWVGGGLVNDAWNYTSIFQGFLQRVDNGCVLIFKVSLVWGVQRVRQKECWWQEVQLCALILAYGSIFVIQALYMA